MNTFHRVQVRSAHVIRGALRGLLCCLITAQSLWAQPAEVPASSQLTSPEPTPSNPTPSNPTPSNPAPSTPAPSTPAPSTPAPSVMVKSQDHAKGFDHMRAWRELTALVHRGQRYYGAPRREEAIADLASRLKRAGAKVSRQTFQKVEPVSGARFQLTNIVGRLMPERPKRILLGSHWDTRLWAEEDSDASRREAPITGANDGSSGLAVLLEVARQVDRLSLGQLGVDVVFFDGEEFGRPGSNDYCAGSRHFAEHLKAYYPEDPPIAVIVIDMVGDQDLSFPPEQSSVVNARALTTLIWREGVRLRAPAFLRGLGLEDPNQPRPAPQGKWIIDDHTPFQKLKIPATLIIDLEYPQWHTHQDTLDRVSPQSLLQTGEVLIASLKRLDQLSASQPSRSSTSSP